MPTSTSGRLLALLSLLQTRRDWAGDELADRLEVSPRTIRRDVDRLRELGYPVESATGPAGGYRLAAGTAMPPLLLDDDEAIAIAVGLRTAAGSGVTGIEETAVRALVKLEQVLPAHLRRRVGALATALASAGAPPGPTVDPADLAVLAAACRDLVRIRFGYVGRDGAATRREVEPHGLVHRWRRWYLVAWDVARADWRTFRLDRIEGPMPSTARFVARTVPGGDAAAYVEETIAAAPSLYEVRLRLAASADAVRARHPHLHGALVPTGPHACEYTTSDDHLDWLVMRIGMIDVDAEIVEAPAAVRERLAALRDRVDRTLASPAGPQQGPVAPTQTV